MATHPVKRYEVLMTSKGELLPALKWRSLKGGVKDLLGKGRVPISVDFAQASNPVSDFVVGRYCFGTVYLGRRAVWKGSIRHKLRQSHKDFLLDEKINGIHIPYEVK